MMEYYSILTKWWSLALILNVLSASFGAKFVKIDGPGKVGTAGLAAVLMTMGLDIARVKRAQYLQRTQTAHGIVLDGWMDECLKLILLFGMEDAIIFWAYRIRGTLTKNSARDDFDSLDGTNVMVLFGRHESTKSGQEEEVMEVVKAEPRKTNKRSKKNSSSNNSNKSIKNQDNIVNNGKSGVLFQSFVKVASGFIPVLVLWPSEVIVTIWICFRIVEAFDQFIWEAGMSEGDLDYASWRPGFFIPYLSNNLHRSRNISFWLIAAFGVLEEFGSGLGVSSMVLLWLCLVNASSTIMDQQRLPNMYLFVLSIIATLMVRAIKFM